VRLTNYTHDYKSEVKAYPESIKKASEKSEASHSKKQQ
jgi:hypothetical protein